MSINEPKDPLFLSTPLILIKLRKILLEEL